MAEKIVLNAKVQRPGVCNAIETLLIDSAIAPAAVPILIPALIKAGVEIRGDEKLRAVIHQTGVEIPGEKEFSTKLTEAHSRGDRGAMSALIFGKKLKLATEEDWTTEYLDLILAVRVVDGLDGALKHLAKYSSHHSDSIITEDAAIAERYLNEVDSATVYWNASTRFTDGGEFGFGAEIGISTDKLHARGPMGLEELTSYKYVIRGNGQVRS
jgi:glutamate-5-semialdehyde dehydrogenase